MKIQFILLVLCTCISIHINAQSGIVLGAGASMGFTDNPATSEKGQMLSGYHGSLTARLGKNYWYLRPGVEVHKIQLLPHKMLDPFRNEPGMVLLKFPAQLGLRIIKSENFNFRITGGMQFTYILSIEENSQNINFETLKETQFGALVGAGIDLGYITFDVNFEKGMTELYTDTGYTSDYIFVTMGFVF
jgi:hypothetical protein